MAFSPCRRTRFLTFTFGLLTLCGCAVPNSVPTASPIAASALKTPVRGNVHGGQQPVAGAIIQLYTLGDRVDGYPGTALINQTVRTDANGGFDITGLYTCPSNAVTYLTATGGNPGLGSGASNPNSAVMSVVDLCDSLNPQTFININEVTTAGTVAAYGQFFSQYPYIGTALSNAAPNYLDLIFFQQIVNSTTGASPGTTFPSGMQYPFTTLYDTANIIASCINSAGGVAGDGSSCGNLFALTTPPGGTAPTNTVDALVNMQRYPTQNVAQLFALASPAAPFQPADSTAPANWYLRLTAGAPATPKFNLCTTWGDSLTLGSEDNSGITVADTLPKLKSCYWGNNQGVGGQNSTQIGIREGGISSTATIAGGVIPASGNVVVSFPPASSGVSPNGPGYITTTISGVPGIIYFDGSQGTTVFARTTPGLPVNSPANTPYKAILTNENSGFVVLWAGVNDGYTQQTTILNNIAAMVAALPSPKHFVVLSLPNTNQAYEYAGTDGYNGIININNALAAAYPDNYIDERALVIANYDPTSPEDVIDHMHDTTPTSMRAIDAFGDLTAGIDAQTCTFSVENGGISGDYTMNIEQEKIRIVSSDGTNITACTRGYASTTAVPHAAKTKFNGVDYIHLNHLADALIAQAIDNYIQAH